MKWLIDKIKEWNVDTFLYIIASILVLISFVFVAASYSINDEGKKAFLSNLLLNFVAEGVGFALGIFLTLFAAKKLASEKLTKIGTPIINLISQLRQDETISSKAARKCVICTVKIISEDNLKKELKSLTIKSDEQQCPVCDLSADIHPDEKRCLHCHLPNHVWELKGVVKS